MRLSRRVVILANLSPLFLSFMSTLLVQYSSRKSSFNVNTSVNSSIQANIFLQALRKIDWQQLINSYQRRHENETNFRVSATNFVSLLLPFLVMPPPASQMNQSCGPPQLEFPKDSPICNRLAGPPRKVAVLLTLGFDVDTLEIHLNELDQLVDRFFLFESTRTYHLGVRKPLLWPLLQSQPRFSRFVAKVVHLVMDDSEINGYAHDIYADQRLQEELLWRKFFQYNNLTREFQVDDLIGFGDLDEIPNRNSIYYLKNCEMPSDPIDMAIWFPYGNINQVYHPDYHVDKHPFSLTAPTYWTLEALTRETTLPNPVFKRRGKTDSFLFGGIHMSDYGYIPFKLAKLITVIEGVDATLFQTTAKILEEGMTTGVDKSNEVLMKIQNSLSVLPRVIWKRTMPMILFKKRFPGEYERLVKLPWFYACNPGRYPAWTGNIDDRLLKQQAHFIHK